MKKLLFVLLIFTCSISFGQLKLNVKKGKDLIKKVIDPKDDKKVETKDEAKVDQEETSQIKTGNVEWNKFDFVPGDEIIFEDNQFGEKNGEFPSQWDLTKGTIENAIMDGENVISFVKCNVNGGGGIVPLMKNASEDYLPEQFTIELDAYFEKPTASYRISFLDYKNQKKLDKTYQMNKKWIRFEQNEADGEGINKGVYPGYNPKDKSAPGWRHISVSFNTRALKLYIDDVRILNVPNLGYNPTGITLALHNTGGSFKGYVKNVRIAKGAVPLYDKVMTDGKIVTTGIKFDVNKSVIKPESYGTINEILKIMNDKPELKFRIEGHTDSDGDDASNQKLSEARAKAIMDKLIELGINKDRLDFKGMGETNPVASNSTSEGKANNRRVEFIKF